MLTPPRVEMHPDEVRDEVVEDVRAFSGDAALEDDLTVVVGEVV